MHAHRTHTPAPTQPGWQAEGFDDDGGARLCAQLRRAKVHARLFGHGEPVRVGRFELRRTIGSGGLGTVFAAVDPQLARAVAIKVLRSPRAGARNSMQQLQSEARAMAQLEHVNVARVYEVGRDADLSFVAMELVRGDNLRVWQSDKSIEEVLAAYLGAARGLAAIHEAGLVHRDFKPENVVVGQDAVARVVDFGLARAERIDDRSTLEGDALDLGTTQSMEPLEGTLRYMAPEQLMRGRVGPSADQFAFCVALFEAISGEHPFAARHEQALRAAVLRGPTRPQGMAPSLFKVLRRGLAADPDARYTDMHALVTALERRATSSKGARVRRRRLALALVASVAFGASLWWVAKRGSAGAPEHAASSREGEAAYQLALSSSLAGPSVGATALKLRDWSLISDESGTWWQSDAESKRVDVPGRPRPLSARVPDAGAFVATSTGLGRIEAGQSQVRELGPWQPRRAATHPRTGELTWIDEAGIHGVADDGTHRLIAPIETLSEALLDDPEQATELEIAWAPTGEWVALLSGLTGKTRVFALRPSSGELAFLFEAGPGPSDPCLAWTHEGVVSAERSWQGARLELRPVAWTEGRPEPSGRVDELFRAQNVQLSCRPALAGGLTVVSTPERADEHQWIAQLPRRGRLRSPQPLSARSTTSPVAWLDRSEFWVTARSGSTRSLHRSTATKTPERMAPLARLSLDGLVAGDTLGVVPWPRPGKDTAALAWFQSDGSRELWRLTSKGAPTHVATLGDDDRLAAGRTPKIDCDARGQCVWAERLGATTLRVFDFDPNTGDRSAPRTLEAGGIRVHWAEMGSLAPTGRHYAMANYTDTVVVVDLDAPNSRRARRELHPPHAGDPEAFRLQATTWTPDGRSLIVTGRRRVAEGRFENVLWRVHDPLGRRPRWETLYRDANFWFSAPRVSPDGQWLTFTALDLRATVRSAQLEREG